MKSRIAELGLKAILRHSEQDTLARARELALAENISIELAVDLIQNRQRLVVEALKTVTRTNPRLE